MGESPADEFLVLEYCTAIELETYAIFGMVIFCSRV
jgi:hypothetical protein